MKLHSFLNPKCEVRSKGDNQEGVFAKEKIEKGEIVSIWGGIIYSLEELEDLSKKHPHFLTHPVSVYEGFFLGPTDVNRLDDAEKFNHSCNPNVGVKGQILLVARRNIENNEEICFDYETTEISAEPFECMCGSKNCRRIIDGSAWKNASFQKENDGFFSWYIQEKINNNSKGMKKG